MGEAWQRGYSSEGLEEFSAAGGGKGLFMTPSDLAIKWDAEMLAIAQVGVLGGLGRGREGGREGSSRRDGYWY